MYMDAINMALYHEFMMLMGDGDPSLEQEFLELFLEDTDEHFQAVRCAFEAHEQETLVRLAHTIKSTSAQIGAMRLSELSLKLETMGQSGDHARVSELITNLESEYRRVREVLLSRLG